MGFYDKSRYLRVLFNLAPMGLISIFLSIKGLTTNLDDLPKYEGKIINIQHGSTTKSFKHQSYIVPSLSIKISSRYYTIMEDHIFHTTLIVNMNKIDSLLSKGEFITIWTLKNDRKNEIAQIEKDGKIIIPYEKSIGVYIGFLIFGIIISFIAIGYLIKYPEDLWGNDKIKNKN